MSDEEKVWISYLDENDQRREGYFVLIEKTDNIITFKTNSGNIITIPIQRLLKLKEVEENVD